MILNRRMRTQTCSNWAILLWLYLSAQSALCSDDVVLDDPTMSLYSEERYNGLPADLQDVYCSTEIECALIEQNSAYTRYQKTQAVLNHFGAFESAPTTQTVSENGTRTPPTELNWLRKFLDPKSQFLRFFDLSSNSGRLLGFDDRDSKSVELFNFQLPHTETTPYWKLKLKTNALPRILHGRLHGLRIALDPGHMGGAPWDAITGKYVMRSDGVKLDEGVLNLQISLLLKTRLESLGAQVVITHSDLKPATSQPFNTFKLRPYALTEFKAASFSPWFQSLISSYPIGEELFNAFKRNSEFKEMFSENSSRYRNRYFILRADLESRRFLIERFNPDVTLIIHNDVAPVGTDGHGVNISELNFTKAYVPGGFDTVEFAARADRLHFAAHLLDSPTWKGSVELSRAILKKINSKLKIPLQTSHGTNAVKVENGIFARNLALSRHLNGHPVSYLECLFYNDPSEFRALTNYRYEMKIGTKIFRYSERLKLLAEAIGDGVIDFVTSQ